MPVLDARLRTNIASLFSLQAATYLVPALTLPWLTRVLGPSGYGELGFVMAVAGYLALMVDYGFNLSATRKIAINRECAKTCSDIFWSTMGAKLLLLIAAFVALAIAIAVVPRFGEIKWLLVIATLSVGGAMLTPVWYYQGLERMAGFAAVNSVIKLASVPAIFLFVRDGSDVTVAVFIQAAVVFFAGAINFGWLLWRGQIGRPRIGITQCAQALREGTTLFLAQAGVSFYTAATVVILGLASTNTQVAYFVAAMAVIRLTNGLVSPVLVALFPRVSNLMQDNAGEAIHLVQAMLRNIGVLTLVISAAIFVAAPFGVDLVFGARFAPATEVLQLLAPSVFIVALSNIFGVQVMVPMGYTRAFRNILLGAGAFNLCLLIPLASQFGASGAACSVLFTELSVTGLMAAFLWRNCPQVFGREGSLECRT